MFAQQGRLKKAVFNCGKAIELQPNSARAHMYRLVLYTIQYTCSMYIRIVYVRTYVWVQVGPTLYRGCYRMVMSQNADALEDFDHAAELCPTSSVVFFNRALCQQTLGNLKQVSTTLPPCHHTHATITMHVHTYVRMYVYVLMNVCTVCAVYCTGYWRLHRITRETERTFR